MRKGVGECPECAEKGEEVFVDVLSDAVEKVWTCWSDCPVDQFTEMYYLEHWEVDVADDEYWEEDNDV